MASSAAFMQARRSSAVFLRVPAFPADILRMSLHPWTEVSTYPLFSGRTAFMTDTAIDSEG